MHPLAIIHSLVLFSSDSFSRFLRITTIFFNQAISDINQLPFVGYGVAVLVCLYFMTENQRSFCCTKAKLDQLTVVCNTEERLPLMMAFRAVFMRPAI